jgi:hypothetical protein
MRATTPARSRLCLQILEDRITPDALVNDNAGTNGTANFTQGNTTLVAFDSTVVVAFNDSGSFSGAPNNKFTGWSRSTTGGATFTDGGALPTSAGRIYLSTLGFNPSNVQVFRSDDGGASWMALVNGTPGGSNEDHPKMAIDNFTGPGQGNVYVVARDFSSLNGIYLYRSTDNGATFGPTGGTLIASGNDGGFVTVGPDLGVCLLVRRFDHSDAQVHRSGRQLRRGRNSGERLGRRHERRPGTHGHTARDGDGHTIPLQRVSAGGDQSGLRQYLRHIPQRRGRRRSGGRFSGSVRRRWRHLELRTQDQ